MDIRVEMYCSEWVFSLFASVVPVELMVNTLPTTTADVTHFISW